MIGPGAPIKVPRVVQPAEKHLPDYEVELTIVIGKAAKDVPESEALDYVLAYTNANDVRLPYPSVELHPHHIAKRHPSVTINLLSRNGDSRRVLVRLNSP